MPDITCPECGNVFTPPKQLPLTAQTLLVVEGPEDRAFFDALLRNLGITEIDIRYLSGNTRWAEGLGALKNDSGFRRVTSIGLIRDANGDPVATLQSIQDALRRNALPVPSTCWTRVGNNPSVSIAILPDGQRPGMLEDLCLDAMETDWAMSCLNDYFNCLGKVGTLPTNMSKAKIHAFLASRPDPAKRLGEAAQADYWSWESPAFEQLKQFLRTV